MKPFLCLLSVGALFFWGELRAVAGEVTSQAVVVKVSGRTYVTVTDQAKPTELMEGENLPQGAKVVTSPGAQVTLEVFNGAYAHILENSTVNLEKLSVTTEGGAVTSQTAMLDLKVGSVVSNIDPKFHKINHYAIRTPQGVAAARGTGYTVIVNSAGVALVYVTASTVSVTSGAGSTNVTVGEVFSIDKSGVVSGPFAITSADGASMVNTVLGSSGDNGVQTLQAVANGSSTDAGTGNTIGNPSASGSNTINSDLVSPSS